MKPVRPDAYVSGLFVSSNTVAEGRWSHGSKASRISRNLYAKLQGNHHVGLRHGINHILFLYGWMLYGLACWVCNLSAI